MRNTFDGARMPPLQIGGVWVRVVSCLLAALVIGAMLCGCAARGSRTVVSLASVHHTSAQSVADLKVATIDSATTSPWLSVAGASFEASGYIGGAVTTTTLSGRVVGTVPFVVVQRIDGITLYHSLRLLIPPQAKVRIGTRTVDVAVISLFGRPPKSNVFQRTGRVTFGVVSARSVVESMDLSADQVDSDQTPVDVSDYDFDNPVVPGVQDHSWLSVEGSRVTTLAAYDLGSTLGIRPGLRTTGLWEVYAVPDRLAGAPVLHLFELLDESNLPTNQRGLVRVPVRRQGSELRFGFQY
jgi:hypothetical protein